MSDNYFHQALAMQQNYGIAQQQALQNVQGLWGGYAYGATSAGTAIGTGINYISYDPINYVVQQEEKSKKKKRMIIELREELRKWHGDL